MKVSEINRTVIATYLKLDLDDLSEAEKTELDMILESAKSYTISYTGHTLEELDDIPETTLAVLVVIQDMYDDRSLMADNDKVNLVLKSILGMHSINLL